MPLVSGYMEAPYQGISQAAAAWRVPQQATSLTDCLAEIQKGFRKRPPMNWLAQVVSGVGNSQIEYRLITDPTSGNLIHFLMVNESGVITPYLYDADTLAAIPVTVSSAAATYLATGNPAPHSDLRVLSVEDYNFILNRKVTTALNETPAPSRPFEAIIFIALGGYGWQYNITITPHGGSPIVGEVETPDGAQAADAKWVTTNTIAQAFLGGPYSGSGDDSSVTPINTALASAGFTYSYNNSVIYISHPTIDFTIVGDDGQGGTALKITKEVTGLFSNLPAGGPPDGFTVKIAPPNAAFQDAYYIQYESLANSNTGVWQECIGPGANLGVLASTLPVALTKLTGSWVIDVVAWLGRTTGDATLAPDPGFVGKPLKDITFFAGRLGFLYDEGLAFCADDDAFRLYPTTLVTAIDSDPFEKDNPDTSKAEWEYAVPMYGGLVLAGQRSQSFLTNANPGAFAEAAATIKVIARYQEDIPDGANSDILAPISANNRVYLAIPRSDEYYGFFEFAADRLSGQILPDDISAHVPTLLPSTIDRAASVEPNFAILYGSSGLTNLYLGLFRYANYQRVQTAWFQWFVHQGFTLAGMTAHGALYYFLLLDTSGNIHLASLDLSPDVLDPGAGATVLTALDMRMNETQCTAVYNAPTNTTKITTALPIDATTRLAARAPSVAYPEGYLASIVAQSYNYITVAGNWTAQPFYLGYSYSATWVPTTIYRRSQDNRPITRARLSLTEIYLDVLDVVDLTVTVSVGGRVVRSYSKSKSSFGSPSAQFTGPWRVPVNGKNITTAIAITDASHIGGKVAGFEWFGKHDPFFQRTT